MSLSPWATTFRRYCLVSSFFTYIPSLILRSVLVSSTPFPICNLSVFAFHLSRLPLEVLLSSVESQVGQVLERASLEETFGWKLITNTQKKRPSIHFSKTVRHSQKTINFPVVRTLQDHVFIQTGHPSTLISVPTAHLSSPQSSSSESGSLP